MPTHGNRTTARFGAALLLGAACAVAAACGYRPLADGPSHGAGSIAAVFVPVAKNETAYAGLAGPLTEEVRKQLEALGVDVAAESGGVPILSMVIVGVGDETGMTARRGDALVPSDTVWHVEVMVSLEASDGEQIVPPTRFSGDGRSVATGSAAGEAYTSSRTQREVMDDLAARIAAMVAMLQ